MNCSRAQYATCHTPIRIFCKAFDILLCTLMQYMHIIHKVFVYPLEECKPGRI